MEAGLPSKKEYARQIGADFINITIPKLGGSIAMEKYQIGGLLNDYDRILYLDADLVIDPAAPNIFARIPETHFGIFDESQSTIGPRHALLAWLKDGWPDCPCTFYTNNGVFVCSREHQWLFDYKTLNRQLNTYEQTNMVYRIWEALNSSPPRIKIHWLEKSWNYMPRTWIGGPAPGWIPEPEPDPCWVHHYPCHRPEERTSAMNDLNRRYGLK
jgi:hypothetical protein